MSMLFGWIPDEADSRDIYYDSLARAKVTVKYPAAFSLEEWCAPIDDQLTLSSCVANAVVGCVKCGNSFDASRMFLYYHSRPKWAIKEGVDSGAGVRDSFKKLAAKGTCLESSCPYIPAKFAEAPAKGCAKEALKHRPRKYYRLRNTDNMRKCLCDGHPFVFGFRVFSGFVSASVCATGIVNVPAQGERFIGSHAVCCVGYHDSTQRFICRNSWGTNWGRDGYFTIPYAYVLNANMAGDFWTLVNK